MNYLQAMARIQLLCKSFGYEASSPDLKVPWMVKRMPDGTFLTLWFKTRSIYYTRDNQAVRHFKDARSLHLVDIKALVEVIPANPSYVMDYIESRTKD